MHDHSNGPVDHTIMDDAELEDCRREATLEQEKREKLASIPDLVVGLLAEYEAAGGDRDGLISYVADSAGGCSPSHQ